MPLEKLEYSKNWENPQDFPTYEAREEQVRADIQLLFDEAKNAFNKMIDDLAADLVPFAATPSISASNVQSAIEAVQQQVEDMVMGATPDRSITGVKLALGAVGNDELAEDAVGASNLQNDSVGSEAIAPEAIQTEHYSPSSIPKEAFKSDALDDKADLVSGRVPPLQTTKVVNKVSLASAYTLALSDLGKIIFCQNANAGTINIPTNASAAFAVGAEIFIIQGAAGSVTVSGVSGVTLVSPTGATVLNKINSALKLIKTSTNTWNAYYLDYLPPNSVGTTELANGSVTEAKIASGAVSTGKVADAAVTRAKLAQDALHSPMAQKTDNYAITIADIGMTIRPAWNTDISFNLTQENSAALPLGAEIAIFSFGYTNEVTLTSSGVYFLITGEDGRKQDATVKISETFGMIALKKISNDSSGNAWLVTGNVEVVS